MGKRKNEGNSPSAAASPEGSQNPQARPEDNRPPMAASDNAPTPSLGTGHEVRDQSVPQWATFEFPKMGPSQQQQEEAHTRKDLSPSETDKTSLGPEPSEDSVLLRELSASYAKQQVEIAAIQERMKRQSEILDSAIEDLKKSLEAQESRVIATTGERLAALEKDQQDTRNDSKRIWSRFVELDGKVRPTQANLDSLIQQVAELPTQADVADWVQSEISRRLEECEPRPRVVRPTATPSVAPHSPTGRREPSVGWQVPEDPRITQVPYREEYPPVRHHEAEPRVFRGPQPPRSLRGESIAPTRRGTSIAPDDEDTLSRQIHQVRQQVRKALAYEANEFERPLRMPDFERFYEGSSDFNDFWSFLKDLLRHWQGLLLTGYGPAHVRKRFIMLGSVLKGPALDWFNDASDEESFPEDSEEILVLLLRRFVTISSTFRANKEYEELTFSREAGIHGLYLDIERLSRKMVSPPSERDKSSKFLAELPSAIRDYLVANLQMNAEASLQDLRDAAARYDSGKQLSATLGASSHTAVKKKVAPATTRAPAARSPAVDERRRAPQPSSGGARPSPGFGAPRPQPGLTGRPSTTGATKGSFPALRNRYADYICHACKERGHIAADCPKNTTGGGKRFNAARRDEDDVSIGDTEEEPREFVPSWDYHGEAEETQYHDAESRLHDDENAVEDAVGPEEEEDDLYYQGDILEESQPETVTRAAPMRVIPMRWEYQMKRTESKTRSPTNDGKVVKVDSRMRPRGHASNQPARNIDTELPLTGLVSIKGVKAFALFDSGCTTNVLSSDFAKIANVQPFKLDEPVILQLGMRGSRSNVFQGARVDFSFGNLSFQDVHFDVGNVDRYDVVFGTPFLRRQQVLLNFKDRLISIGRQDTPALTVEQETTAGNNPISSRSLPPALRAIRKPECHKP